MLTIQDAMKKEFGNNLIISDGKNISSEASKADVIVLSLGETTALSEGFNSINNLDLDQDQLLLIDQAASTGKPVVVILTEGRPRTFPLQVDKTSAIVYAGLPGFFGAEAIADIISGDVNPSGKMNISYPYIQGHMLNYNHKSSAFSFLHTLSEELNRWTIAEFGTGLSYSDLVYSEIKLNDTVFNKSDSIAISVSVKNNSKRDANEAVLLFTNDEYASVTRPVKELKRFHKQLIREGESKEYRFVLYPEKDLSFKNKNNENIFESGYFNVYIANKSVRFKIQ
jgi:beta-glucosidase